MRMELLMLMFVRAHREFFLCLSGLTVKKNFELYVETLENLQDY